MAVQPELMPLHRSNSIMTNGDKNKLELIRCGEGDILTLHEIKNCPADGRQCSPPGNSASKNVLQKCFKLCAFHIKEQCSVQTTNTECLVGKGGKSEQEIIPLGCQETYRTMMLAFYLGSILSCACFLMTAHRPYGGCQDSNK